jgi:tetratricopeptide (TPR) repeat protein
MASGIRPQALTTAQAQQLEAAQSLLRAGDADGAQRICMRVVAAAPRAPDAHQLLAICLTETGAVDAAEQSFRLALQLTPDHPLILVNYAASLRRAGRTDEALEALGRAVEVAPGFAKAWIELGLTALSLGQNRRALVSLERAAQLQPDSAIAWQAIGNAQRALGELEAAEAAFRRSTVLMPGNGVAWVNHGVTLRLMGQADRALESFDHAARAGYSAPDLADARTGALLDTGRPDAALELALRVTREFPEFVPGYVTLAHLLWEYGAESAPERSPFSAFRDALLQRPKDHALRQEYARFLLAARETDMALEQIRLLRAQNDQPSLALLEANSLEILGRSDESAALYDRIYSATNDHDASFLNAYTRHLLKAGKWDLAAARALDATRVSPTHQEAWAYLATAWRLLGDPRELWLCDYDQLISMVDVDPPDGFENLTSFLAAVESALLPLHQARREPVQQSLRGGSQTPGRLFGRRDAVIDAASMTLRRSVERWLTTLPSNDQHPFLKYNTRRIHFRGSWSVRLWSSGKHVNHIHPEGWLSSAFYVALPASVRSQSSSDSHAGHIQFGQPPVELGLDLPPRRVIRPRLGGLALFPSYMWHGTVPFVDESPRISIAFDMTPTAS